MTFGKCIWDGCTRHAEKESTGACRTHHLQLRDARCTGCQGPLRNRLELDRKRPLTAGAARVAQLEVMRPAGAGGLLLGVAGAAVPNTFSEGHSGPSRAHPRET